MKVELQTWTGKVGEVRLEHGRAVGSNAHTRRLIASTKIVEPETSTFSIRVRASAICARSRPFHGMYFVALLAEAPA